ncbi:MAG: ATP-binding protein [Gemmatimonas sp.]
MTGQTVQTVVQDADRPWPGLLSFSEDAKDYFHGRDQEIDELVRLFRRETTTVLYGQSGIGKTSLLRAGLFPRLREIDLHPVYIRFNLDDVARVSPEQQIGDAIRYTLDRQRIDGPRPARDGSIWEYLHRHDLALWSRRNKPVRVVLVFDQFEELFIHARRGAREGVIVDELIELLAELVEHRPPAALDLRIDNDAALANQFQFGHGDYHILISFREDFLPEFDGLRSRMRMELHNRLRLRPLNALQAMQSVLGTAGPLVDEIVAQQIVTFVTGTEQINRQVAPEEQEINPAILSLVCYQLNERRLDRGLPRIEPEMVAGSKEEILRRFYQTSVRDVDPLVSGFIEKELATASGFRQSLPLMDALKRPGVSMDAISALIQLRILRTDDRQGVKRLELSHDVLVPIVVAEGERRRRVEESAMEHARKIDAEWSSRRIRNKQLRNYAGISVLMLCVIAATVWVQWRDRNQQLAGDRINARQLHALMFISGSNDGCLYQRYATADLDEAKANEATSPGVQSATSARALDAWLTAERDSFKVMIDDNARDARASAYYLLYSVLSAQVEPFDTTATVLNRTEEMAQTLADAEKTTRPSDLQVAALAHRAMMCLAQRHNDTLANARSLRRAVAAVVAIPARGDSTLAELGQAAEGLYELYDAAAPTDEIDGVSARSWITEREVALRNAWVAKLPAYDRRVDDLGRAWSRRSQAYFERREFTQAMTANDSAIEYLGRAYRQDTTEKDVESSYFSVLGSDSYKALFAKDYKRAIASADEAIRLHPTNRYYSEWIVGNKLDALLLLRRFPEADTLTALFGPKRVWFSNTCQYWAALMLNDFGALRREKLINSDFDDYERYFRQVVSAGKIDPNTTARDCK